MAISPSELIFLEGTVSSVIYRNEENGYTILRLDTPDGDEVTVVGTMPGISPGEGLSVHGQWKRHSTYGEQLQAEIDSIKTTIVNAGISERNAAASAAAALESKNGAVSARDLSQAYLQQSIQYYTRTEGSAARAAESALQAEQRAKEAQDEAREAETQANRAQAEADRATVPAVAGIYNIIIPDRTTGEKYAVLFEGGKLYLLGVAATMQATDFVLVDSASGKNYRLGVENKLLIVEEV